MPMQTLADKLAAAVTVLLPVLTAFAGWAVAQLGKSRKADKALTEGVKSLLRGQIIDLGLHYINPALRAGHARKLLYRLCGPGRRRPQHSRHHGSLPEAAYPQWR